MGEPKRGGGGTFARRFAMHAYGKRRAAQGRASLHIVGRALGAATAFLTRTPGLTGFRFDAADLVRGAPAFPVVGAAVGALVGGTVLAGSELGLPVLPLAAIAVGLEVVVTGALHLDGLADSADGLAGHTRERRLQIMRDHGVGVYGASAIVLDLLVKVGAVATLPRPEVVPVLVATFAVSRAAPLPLAAACPYAGGDGTGRDFVSGARWTRTAAGLGLAAAVAILAAGATGLAMLGCLALVVSVVGLAARRRLGGVTGDVLGAAVELTALACLLVGLAMEM